jgi:PAS domain S-box-containing protein
VRRASFRQIRSLLARDGGGALDDLAELAARALHAPVAMIELRDADGRWLRACAGFPAPDPARELGPAALVASSAEPLVVADALADDRFRKDPLVADEPRLRSFASVPLLAAEGAAIGAITAGDRVRRHFGHGELESLRIAARQVCRLAESAPVEGAPSDAERLLSENEERLRLAMQIGKMATWEWNVETGEVRRSGSVDRIAGESPGGLERTPEGLLRRVHPDDRERVDGALREARDTGTTYRADYRLVRPDGRIVWCSGVGRLVPDASGRLTRMIGIGADISERKHAELEREELLRREKAAREEAQAANRAKDEFLAILSHELRTPLNAILGWSQLLRADDVAHGEAAVALATIERNARLQQQLVADLLDVSRIVQGEMRLEISTWEPAALVRAGLETLRPAILGKRLTVVESFQPTGPMCGDARRVQQIVWNLLSNAVKFSESGGTIEVDVRDAGSHVTIVVRDHGVGIPPEFLPHVFERFRQADSSSTRSYGGLGLGLAIVRHLAEMHGGTVAAASDGVGKGATFTVTLPRIPSSTAQGEAYADGEDDEDVEASADALLGGLPLGRLRVLVVDDEEDARDLIAASLVRSGAEVLTVGTAIEAMAEVERWRPHVLVSDIAMPDSDGLSLIRELRARELATGGHLPAVALTAYAGAEMRRRALDAGFQSHVAKPFEARRLVALIGRLARPN